MNKITMSHLQNCRSRPAGPPSNGHDEKRQYGLGIKSYPRNLPGSERVSAIDRTLRAMKTLVIQSLIRWGERLIAIASPPLRASTPAVSYMGFSATPAR